MPDFSIPIPSRLSSQSAHTCSYLERKKPFISMELHQTYTLRPGVLRHARNRLVQKWENAVVSPSRVPCNPHHSRWPSAFSKSRPRRKSITSNRFHLKSTFQATTSTTSFFCHSFIVLLSTPRSPASSHTLSLIYLSPLRTNCSCFPTDILYRMKWCREPRIRRSGRKL